LIFLFIQVDGHLFGENEEKRYPKDSCVSEKPTVSREVGHLFGGK